MNFNNELYRNLYQPTMEDMNHKWDKLIVERTDFCIFNISKVDYFYNSSEIIHELLYNDISSHNKDSETLLYLILETFKKDIVSKSIVKLENGNFFCNDINLLINIINYIFCARKSPSDNTISKLIYYTPAFYRLDRNSSSLNNDDSSDCEVIY